MNKFLYLDTEIADINANRFLVIYVLEIEKKIIFKIYKAYTKELAEKLRDLKQFTNITDKTFYAVKRDGKISLDINL